MMRTYCTTVHVSAQHDAVLVAYAELFARAEHTLHAEVERKLAKRGQCKQCRPFVMPPARPGTILILN